MESEGQIRWRDFGASGEDRRFRNDVAQLAHIARPRMRPQGGYRRRREGEARVLLLQKELADRDDVFGPLPQGRNRDVDLAQAVEQIAAETPVHDRFLQLLIRGRDDADIDGDLTSPPQTVRGCDGEDPQQV